MIPTVPSQRLRRSRKPPVAASRASPLLCIAVAGYCRSMPEKVRIALDAMGGDHGATVVIPGAELARGRHPDIEFLLFGDRAVVDPLLVAHPGLTGVSRLVHTDVAVKMDAKPS